MAVSDEPIRQNEVGTYGDLMSRPNPDGLVVVTAPDFDLLIPMIEKNRGRKLTQIEIEQERQRAPSIVLTKEQAEKLISNKETGNR